MRVTPRVWCSLFRSFSLWELLFSSCMQYLQVSVATGSHRLLVKRSLTETGNVKNCTMLMTCIIFKLLLQIHWIASIIIMRRKYVVHYGNKNKQTDKANEQKREYQMWSAIFTRRLSYRWLLLNHVTMKAYQKHLNRGATDFVAETNVRVGEQCTIGQTRVKPWLRSLCTDHESKAIDW